jgi:hypothetical protein
VKYNRSGNENRFISNIVYRSSGLELLDDDREEIRTNDDCSQSERGSRLAATDYPDSIRRMTVFKEALILMYSQHPDALEELTQNFAIREDFLVEKMQSFYRDIIDMNDGTTYVLK